MAERLAYPYRVRVGGSESPKSRKNLYVKWRSLRPFVVLKLGALLADLGITCG